MNKQYQRVMSVAVVAMCLMVTGRATAGSLDPANAPGPTMHTLEEIYQKQVDIDQKVGAFMSPQTLSSNTVVVNAGYYAATNLTQVDADLVAGNIATNVTIFGVVGTLNGNTYSAAVPKTGQTTSYATGDDGDLERGVMLPSSRFTDNSNGTVKDNLTGLIWLKNANAFTARTWAQALTDCNALSNGTAGLTDNSVAGDWRLPNRKELDSLIDLERVNPALPSGHLFIGVQSDYYWSSSTDAGNTACAWYVYLSNGVDTTGGKSTTGDVLPVRGGQ